LIVNGFNSLTLAKGAARIKVESQPQLLNV